MPLSASVTSRNLTSFSWRRVVEDHLAYDRVKTVGQPCLGAGSTGVNYPHCGRLSVAGERILGMESLYQYVTPRDDVLSGNLTEAMFAASLEEVAADTGPETYRDAGTFFTGTYPSG